MKNNYWFLLLTLFIGLKMKAQVADSTFVEVDSVEVDTVPIFIPENGIQNPKEIAQFLETEVGIFDFLPMETGATTKLFLQLMEVRWVFLV